MHFLAGTASFGGFVSSTFVGTLFAVVSSAGRSSFTVVIIVCHGVKL